MPAKNRFMAGTALLCAVHCAAMCVPAGCGSGRIVRLYGPNGALREVQVREKGAVARRIVFEYDQSGKPASVSRYLGGEKKPSAVRSFSFDAQGRMRLQSHRETVPQGSKAAEDAWVESYFYNSSGELTRFETSYKSSLSIARNKTPLQVTHYFYRLGEIERIVIFGGITRKEILLSYKDSEPVSAEYRVSTFNNTSKKYQPSAHLVFYLKRGAAFKSQDRATGAVTTAKKEVERLFGEEKIGDSLNKPRYLSDINALVSELERDWTR